MASSEAEQLFVERALATAPSFALTNANRDAIVEICRRLDGIPLAIELAAARVRVLSPEQIAQRLDDAFRLLTSGSRTALARHRHAARDDGNGASGARRRAEQVLAAPAVGLRGSFSLDAAEAVCVGDPTRRGRHSRRSDGARRKSLRLHDRGRRNRPLPAARNVRQYGLERLRDAGETERSSVATPSISWT
jgi:predicted ATPase